MLTETILPVHEQEKLISRVISMNLLTWFCSSAIQASDVRSEQEEGAGYKPGQTCEWENSGIRRMQGTPVERPQKRVLGTDQQDIA